MSRTAAALLGGFLIAAAVRAQETGPDSNRLDSVLSPGNPLVTEGDRHYSNRASGRVGSIADPRPILAAISAYDKAAQAPDQLEARWKLARALYFRGAFTGLQDANKKPVFERARGYAEEAIRMLGERARRRGFADPESLSPERAAEAHAKEAQAPAVYFWAAVSWGEWALAAGKLVAAQRGAAEKIRRYCETVIALDPEYEEGGGFRILGRLHTEAPRLPILTPWISREQGIGLLRRAIETGPRNFVNRLFLGEALWEHGGAAGKTEALRILQELTEDSPPPTHLVEGLRLQEIARRDLAEWRKAAGNGAS